MSVCVKEGFHPSRLWKAFKSSARDRQKLRLHTRGHAAVFRPHDPSEKPKKKNNQKNKTAASGQPGDADRTSLKVFRTPAVCLQEGCDLPRNKKEVLKHCAQRHASSRTPRSPRDQCFPKTFCGDHIYHTLSGLFKVHYNAFIMIYGHTQRSLMRSIKVIKHHRCDM